MPSLAPESHACPRVSGVRSYEVEVLLRHRLGGLLIWNRNLATRHELRRSGYSHAREMLRHASRHDLAEQGRHRVADLPCGRHPVAYNLDVIRKSLQTAQLPDAEEAILPVERPGGGTRLRLNRP